MSIAAATMPPVRPHTPGDEELQELYDEVWEGFKPFQSDQDADIVDSYDYTASSPNTSPTSPAQSSSRAWNPSVSADLTV